MRKKGLIVFLTLLLLTGLSADTSKQPNSMVSSERPDGVFKILNYNILETGKFDEWKDVVKTENADVLLLTETGKWDPNDGTFADAVDMINSFFPNETPYEGYTFSADSSTDGQVVLSRFPIISTVTLDQVTLDDGSSYNMNHAVIDVVVEIYSTNIHFIVIHHSCCDSGLPSRLLEQEGINNYIDTIPTADAIIYAGDFNSASPEDTLYIGENDNLGTEPIEMILNSTHEKGLNTHQFVDMYRTLNPYGPGYTYVDTFYQSRLDYVFANEHLFDALVNASVVNDYLAGRIGSDHMPLRAWFNLNPAIDLRPPLPVSGVNVAVNTESTTLGWNEINAVDLYKYSIYRNSCLITDVVAGTHSFVDDYEYFSNSVYYYNVYAVDTNENFSPKSVDVAINSSRGQLAKPGIPEISITTNGEGIVISWTEPTDGNTPIINYQVYRSTSADGLFALRSTTSKNNFTDVLPKSNLELFYKVRAYNAWGYSNFSAIVSDFSPLAVTTTQSYSQDAHSSIMSTTTTQCPEPIEQLRYVNGEVSTVTTETQVSNSSDTSTTTSSVTSSSVPTTSNTSDSPLILLTLPGIIVLVLIRKRK